MELSIDPALTKDEIRKKTRMPLLYVGIASIVMIFASLTSAVIVSKGTKAWVEFQLPVTFLVSTVVIMLSSVTYYWAYRSAKANRFDAVKTGVLLTLILGVTFAVIQIYSWGQLVDQGIFFAGPSSSISGSYLYVLSGVHLAHLAGGLISLMVVYSKSVRKIYTSNNLLGLQASTTYWHFLDGLWVYLYIFLSFIAL